MKSDIEIWLESGKGMLKTLEERREVLSTELRSVDAEIVKVRKAMGLAPEGAGSKVMIRSVIKQVLMAIGTALSEVSLIAEVQLIQPKATEASIRTSLARALRQDAWCQSNPDGSYSYAKRG